MIGVFSTLAYAVLYLLLRGPLGPFWANAIALVSRRSRTPPRTGGSPSGCAAGRGAVRHQVQGLAIFGVGLAVTTGALWLLQAATPSPGRYVEMVVLTAANLFVTVMRFVAMRLWVFARPGLSARASGG